ncbi:MAG: hypothetical protein R2753_13180 [Chitinophagales bacterium]
MEDVLSKFKESVDSLLVEVNGKAEEIKENFNSFKDVFGKELDVQSENLKTYKSRLEAKGKKIFDSEAILNDVKEEAGFVINDVKTSVDRLLDIMKDTVSKAK